MTCSSGPAVSATSSSNTELKPCASRLQRASSAKHTLVQLEGYDTKPAKRLALGKDAKNCISKLKPSIHHTRAFHSTHCSCRSRNIYSHGSPRSTQEQKPSYNSTKMAKKTHARAKSTHSHVQAHASTPTHTRMHTCACMRAHVPAAVYISPT